MVHKAMNGGEWHVLALETQSAIAMNMKLYNTRSVENNELQVSTRKYQAQLLWLISVKLCLGFVCDFNVDCLPCF